MKTYIVQYRIAHGGILRPLDFDITAACHINAIIQAANVLKRNIGLDVVEIVATQQ